MGERAGEKRFRSFQRDRSLGAVKTEREHTRVRLFRALRLSQDCGVAASLVRGRQFSRLEKPVDNFVGKLRESMEQAAETAL
jgi:hypothetical protein